MQGLGNDYLYIEDLDPQNPFLKGDTKVIAQVCRKMSRRNFGVGSDGIALIQQSNQKEAHFKMRLFNADGSEGNSRIICNF